MYGDGNLYSIAVEASITKTALDKVLLPIFKDVRYVDCKDNVSARDTGNRRIADGCYIRRCKFLCSNDSNRKPSSLKKAKKVEAVL